MGKLPICRICLVQNVRMYLVVNRNFHALYEKLTDIPFVTEDRRPILACFFCCAKLKQCWRFQKKCLAAEELFAQMMNEDYEPNPLINKDHPEFLGGFIKSPIVHVNIVEFQTESIATNEELPAVCEGLDDIIEPKEEYQSDELELENLDDEFLGGFIKSPIVHASVVDECQTESGNHEGLDDIIEPKEEHQSDELELENVDNSFLDVADIPPYHSESDSEDDVPLMEFKTEVEEEQEVTKKKRRARETKRAAAAKKPKLEDAITVELSKNEKSDSEVIRTTQKRTTKPYFKEPYKCHQRSFNRVKESTQHTRPEIGKKTYKCDVCPRSYRQKSSLTKHIRIHTGEKPYKCDVCLRSFIQKSDLTNHIRIHTGEKPYMCDVCQRSFSRMTHLTEHIRIHTGEKPYKCDICLRSFNQKSNLRKHNRRHTGEKPYKCDVCQRSFRDKGALSQHIRIHTGEKPYKCDVCLHSFNQKSNLIKHIRRHNGEKPYKCDVCQRSFIRKTYLTKHSRIHTGETP